jgi:TM2 domain-containing membrane protein YozV
MKCYVHPDVDAVGTCTVCGKSVCQNCAVDMNGKLTCKSCVEKMATQPGSAAGAGTVAAPAPVRKEPIFSIILSFFLPGLGQIYNGHVKKGIILAVVYIVLWIAMIIVYFAGALVTMGIGAFCCLPAFLVPLVIWVYGMYDAYVVAGKINRGEYTKDWL